MMLIILSWILYSKAVIGLAFPIVVTVIESISIGYRIYKAANE